MATEPKGCWPFPPGLYCVPSAIIAVTGEDLLSVVLPSLNRAQDGPWLQGPVSGVKIRHAVKALEEIGYAVRAYKGKEMQRRKLRSWAKFSERPVYRSRRFLASTAGHMLALCNGKAYDTFTPIGVDGLRHPYSNDLVVWAALIERRST